MMKIVMNVIDVKELDEYIDAGEVPFVICTPPYGVTSNRQQKYLDTYYDKVVDKKGFVSYYCNVINAYKCNEMDYKCIKFADGEERNIRGYTLSVNRGVGEKYIVSVVFNTGKNKDVLELTESIRTQVEITKAEVNKIQGQR